MGRPDRRRNAIDLMMLFAVLIVLAAAAALIMPALILVLRDWTLIWF